MESQKCLICKTPLNDIKSWKMPAKLGDFFVPYCYRCQARVYTWIASCIGYKLAMFFSCAMFNLPYLPLLITESKQYSKERGTWGAYVATVKRADKEEGKVRGFSDGITDIRKAFGGSLATVEITDEMREDELYKSGPATIQELFGHGPKKSPYKPEDYDFLLKTYNALTEERPYRNAQTELAIQKICKWTLEQEKCMQNKEFADAQKIGALIKTEMEGETLRKRDEKAADVTRLDDIVLAVERAGLDLYDYGHLCEQLSTMMFHSKYGLCRDAADQMLLMIANISRWNEGEEALDTLPKDFRITDTLGEFAEEQDEIERKNYRDLQLVPMKAE